MMRARRLGTSFPRRPLVCLGMFCGVRVTRLNFIDDSARTCHCGFVRHDVTGARFRFPEREQLEEGYGVAPLVVGCGVHHNDLRGAVLRDDQWAAVRRNVASWRVKGFSRKGRYA